VLAGGDTAWGGRNGVPLRRADTVKSGVVGLCSKEEYKCMRNCISLVLLVLDVINDNVEVLFHEGTSLYYLLNLILHLHCPCEIWKLIHG